MLSILKNFPEDIFVHMQQKLQSFFLARRCYNRTLICTDIISTRRKLIAIFIVLTLDSMFCVRKRSLGEYVTMKEYTKT